MRILFVKTSSLGDVIHHCPAVSDVRQQFADATIDWVVEESFADIVEMHPAIRRAIPVAVRRWRRRLLSPGTWAEIREFQRTIRGEAYDLVIDTQGLLKSALIASRTLGVKHGYDSASAREPMASRFYDAVHPVPVSLHAVERNRALTAAALQVRLDGTPNYGLVAPRLTTGDPRTPFCVLLSMTSRPDKLWPEDQWVALAQGLARAGIESVFPWGTTDERARCQRIVTLAGTGKVPERMSLSAVASLMRQAQLVFGVDTGLAHLAAALQVPVIGLYVRSDPALTGVNGQGKVLNLGGPGSMPSVKQALDAAKALA